MSYGRLWSIEDIPFVVVDKDQKMEISRTENMFSYSYKGHRDVGIIHTDVNTCNSYHQESQFIPYLSVNVHYLIPSIKNLNSY